MQWQIGGCDEPGKDKVEPCFELQAAMKKGVPEPEIEPQKKAKKTEPAGEEFVDDDIPF
jgi:hypothetical protein